MTSALGTATPMAVVELLAPGADESAADSRAQPLSIDPVPALCVIARLHHVAAEPAALRHQLGKAASDPIASDDLLLAAKNLGLKAKRSRSSAEQLKLAPLPALALLNDGRWVVLAQSDGQRVLIQDAGAEGSRPTIEPLDAFAAQWSGQMLLVASRASLAGELVTRYGTVPAQVKRMTADAVADEKRSAVFPATLTLSRSAIEINGQRVALAPGMNLSAEIKTGRRRVIEYFLSPARRAVNEIFGGR